jgi:hypothetical protein
MPNESQAIEVENAADREVREHRTRLVYVLRSNGFPSLAAMFAALGSELEGEREYVGEPAPAEPRRLQTMAFSDGGLNLFRPPPMSGAQEVQTVPQVMPVHEATEEPPLFTDSTQPTDAERRARIVLAQRGIHKPTDEQVQDVLRSAPWLGAPAAPTLPSPSQEPPAPEPTL